MRTILLFSIFVVSACQDAQAPKGQPTDQKPIIKILEKKKGDGPFGIDLAAMPADLDFDKEMSIPEKGRYLLNSVPSPDINIDTYLAIAFDNIGICGIHAISSPVSSDDTGIEIRSKVDNIAEAMSTKYGEPTKYDRCYGTDVECERQFWSYSLRKNARSYAYVWDKMPENVSNKIRHVGIFALADNTRESYYKIEYGIGNEAECKSAEKAATASNL